MHLLIDIGNSTVVVALTDNSGNIIGQLYTGDSVQLIGGSTSGSYVQVYSPKLGATGWVNAGFLG